MKKLNFDTTKEVVEFILISTDVVPMIMGERGIGKSALVNKIAKEHGWDFCTVDCNTLNPGEIGGIPYLKTIEKDGKSMQRFTYSPHWCLKKCLDAEKKNKTILLFFDELNRCDSNVKRELMNVILNKNINGTFLGNNVKIVAAMNPSSDFDDFADAEYQVEDMDEAQKDRFNWVIMESDIFNWLTWAEKEGLNSLTMEFLASNIPLLNNVKESRDNIKTSERSWEWVSKRTDYYQEHGISDEIFLSSITGLVGDSIAIEYLNFIQNNENPLVKAIEIFEGESAKRGSLTPELEDKLRKENLIRKHIIKNNLTYYMVACYNKEKNKVSKDKKKKLSDEYLTKEKLYIDCITDVFNIGDLMMSALIDLNRSTDTADKDFLKRLLDIKNDKILSTFVNLQAGVI